MDTQSEAVSTITSLLFRGFYSTTFQPIVDTGTGKSIGFESLLRGPEGTLLADPRRLFNEIGYLPEDTLLTLDRACIDSAVRTGKNLPDKTLIFINIMGATMIRMAPMLNEFLSLLGELQIDPARIVFEVSETTNRELTEHISAVLHLLQRSGIRVALDDIGVRSPYLYHLLYLEPEFIKLDRIFIKDIDRDGRKQDLVHCMTGMARTMGARLIAEGIETAQEFEVMKALGVPLSQGYYLGRPQPAKQWQLAGAAHCTGRES
jgi:EAL domain-containing protein (putative c-di-GMP-specific phosphodiesterase class I)